MPFTVAGFNVGTDFSAMLMDNFGDIFPLSQFGLVMDFESESLDRELEVVPISDGGVPLFQTIWAGVRGRISFTRQNGQLQQMISDLMGAYHDFGVIPEFEIAAAVVNRDGSVDEYLYHAVQLSRPHFGDYRAEKEVTMRLEFRASRMVVTSSVTSVLLNLPV